QLPSNNKAGYVIRRILRRAVRYAYTFLHFKEPFLYELVPLLAKQFEGVFDELITQQEFVQKVVLEEEQSFLHTLVAGVSRFEHYVSEHRSISGAFAFELYDTFGFPIDLTELLAKEKGVTVDMQGFNRALNEQKDRSRAATVIDADDWKILQTGDAVEFVGYDQLECETEILKYRKITAKGKDQYQIVLRATPFYAEGGGQVGDTGLLIGGNGSGPVVVTDTRRENGLLVHYTTELPVNPREMFIARVDAGKRRDTEANHSATHLLHAALKQVLGGHVNQKGSLVNANYLRFDFSHFTKVSEDELTQIERIVNAKIRENIPLKEERGVPFQQAIDAGVTALFGEKYGDKVRVITFDEGFSQELCGGTHVRATGQIGFFKLSSESAVAAGVRRIEAITGSKAEQFVHEQSRIVNQIGELLNSPKDFVSALGRLLEENNSLKKEVEQALVDKALQLKGELVAKAEDINGVKTIITRVNLPSADAVKTLSYALKGYIDNLFLVLGTDIGGKPGLTVVISDKLVKEHDWNAAMIVRELAKEIKGGGGGQPFYATAGGKDISGLDEALAKARTYVQSGTIAE
ncbi:MAG TPA: alanine--tRNA ligase, partial [Parapedobacter sp.]|nr:alanine--tRNA ligase [Parapedobacter sp.]